VGRREVQISMKRTRSRLARGPLRETAVAAASVGMLDRKNLSYPNAVYALVCS